MKKLFNALKNLKKFFNSKISNSYNLLYIKHLFNVLEYPEKIRPWVGLNQHYFQQKYTTK